MAEMDYSAKLLNLKRKIQEGENERLKLKTQLEVAIKTLKDKYGLTSEEAKKEMERLREKIKTNREKIKRGIKEVEEKYDLE